MPLQATSGAASYDAFGGGAASVPQYIEDVFSTYLYTGTGTADNKITNNIDLSTKGGMVWLKSRSGAYNNYLTTNATATSSGGGTTWLYSNTTDALLGATGTGVCNFFTDGFDINPTGVGINGSGQNYSSWTFRKQPKWFDIQTWTGNGTEPRTISHNLGSVPGCIIVKVTSGITDNWVVYHRSLGTNQFLKLNTTDAVGGSASVFSSAPNATSFFVGNDSAVNQSACTYVAYLFAHDAGGFGLTGTDNVISCGTYTGPGTGGTTTVTLGYEPQWVLIKRSDGVSDWSLFDNMRGMPVSTTATDARLLPNLSDAEENLDVLIDPTATGFTVPYSTKIGVAASYIYIAIRRGPMKVPTSGTSVFAPIARTGTSSSNTAVTAGFPVDAAFIKASSTVKPWDVEDRLRGGGKYLEFQSTAAEVAGSPAATINFTASNTGVLLGTDSYVNSSANSYANYFLQRAPSFFDEVCYSGTDVIRTVTHNLAAVPQLMIVKSRIGVASWIVYDALNGATNATLLNTTNASFSASGYWNNTAPTSSVFTVGANGAVNGSGQTYVAYLFATCAGVSKCFNYTGNGSSQTINCGFTGGARWILIKRTDSTGDWYCWDSARGIVSGNDPHLSLNSTAAEVTTDDSVDTDSTGFIVNQLSATNINVSSATYIGIAIA